MAKGYNRYIKFSWAISSYFPDALQSGFTPSELRKEYTRLRDVAVKRLGRLKQSEFKDTGLVKRWEFPKIKDMKNTSDLAHALTNVARFLTSATGSVSGMQEYRRRQVNGLQEAGLSFVTEENFLDFTDFMDWLDTFDKNYYPSNTMQMLEKGLTEKHMDFDQIRKHFEDHQEELKQGLPIPEYSDE